MVTKSAARPTTNPTTTVSDDAAPFQPSENDIIDDILALVIAMSPDFQAALARQISEAARKKWGGDRPYIARRSGEGRSSRNEQIIRDYQNGEHIPLLERRYRLSKARIWQIISSKP